MKNQILNYLAVLLCTLIVGCSATYQVKKYPNSQVKSTSEMAKIVIIRKGILDFTSSIKILQDNIFVGRLGTTNRFIQWEVAPKSYLLTAKSGGKLSNFELNATADKTYYFVLKKQIGIPYGVVLEAIDSDEGEALVSNLKPPKVNYVE
jgi:hypothetical protein